MQRRAFATAMAASMGSPLARALMAGSAPDSPTLRLDANRADSPFACAASLMGGGVYSAVCITRTWALTAAHVAQHAESLQLYLNLGSDLSHRYPIKRVAMPPVPAIDPYRPVGDLALVEIDGRFPDEMMLPALAATPAQEGLRIELVGYGASGLGDRGATIGGNAALKRVGANRIDRVLRSTDSSHTPLLYFFSFDAVSDTRHDVGRSLGNRIETGLASGDSGGPAFVMENGHPALLGINTFVIRSSAAAAPLNGFGTTGGGQALAAYKPWLRSVMGGGIWAGLD